ncbi:sodium/proton-translocating pyrophosphatase, partial [Candidatus Poribacteria bacterium]|nr:sodium/proton-translocating pyrophosphatase [Candidatus Poribacteria bacterium]
MFNILTKRSPRAVLSWLGLLAMMLVAGTARASEADLIIPDLKSVDFLGVSGHGLLLFGLLICLAGVGFGLMQYMQIRNLPVHKAMLEVSELIYETCKTYLITQGKFLAVLWAFIAAIMVVYFGFLLHFEIYKVAIIVAFSVVGILGSYAVAWFGIRINTFANSRTAFASLGGK